MELNMKDNLGIKDAMTYNVITANTDTNISDIAAIMTEHNISSVVIEDQKVEGIVTSNNIISKVVSKNISPQDITADMVMDKFISVNPETSLIEASSLMIKNNCKVLLVIDDNQQLKGILTLTDIVRVSPELIELFVEETNIDNFVDKEYSSESDERLEEGVCEKCGVYGQLENNNGQYLCQECIDDKLSEE
ncbi:CBS domain-containing protein [Methanosphaera sp.]|uniref:CBS domain-containing protein n=1 Tax=Methanosphaera sp. TaxID=2666342 RepID=UPI003D8F9979